MNSSFEILGDFGGRYAFESFSDGDGVLVDLKTGSYFRVNATAAKICEVLRDASALDEAISEVSKSVSVPKERAADLIAAVGKDLLRGIPAEEPIGPLRYLSQPDGSAIFEENGRPIFSIASGSRAVRFHASPAELSGPVVLYLQALVPKLLALLDIPVLHAAACSVGGRLLAFSGRSGAGKTTTARAFKRAGALLFSEDLVVLSLGDESPLMYLQGEKFARDWARRVAPRLDELPARELNFDELADAPQGATAPLAEMWFLDVARRAGSHLELRPLSVANGVLALLHNGMLATSRSDHWRDFLRRSRFIAERTSLKEATAPAGLNLLEAAADLYIVKSAS